MCHCVRYLEKFPHIVGILFRPGYSQRTEIFHKFEELSFVVARKNLGVLCSAPAYGLNFRAFRDKSKYDSFCTEMWGGESRRLANLGILGYISPVVSEPNREVRTRSAFI